MPHRLLSLVLLLAAIAPAAAQSQSQTQPQPPVKRATISGMIVDAGTGEATDPVNVLLQSPSRRTMYGYTTSRADGSYTLEWHGTADTLLVTVTGFNIAPQSKRILARTQRVDFSVSHADLKIREVTVKAPPVERRSDTLSYTVSKYADVADRSIGDVLRKMPGIEVSKAGEVKYNGKTINKFYIEGLDMLGGRYGIATNNIQAKDIARVEVYENHQPIKALKKLVDTDRAALNLRLKESAKGTWSGTMQLGGGYKPAMWSGELTAMYFGRRFQTLDTYKTNNTGDDVSRELKSLYGGLDEASTLLGVHAPTVPSLDERRYLDNNIHTVSLNSITKLRKELELTANAQYHHDYRLAEGSSTTTHHLPDGAPLDIRERISTARRTDRTTVDLQLQSNAEKRYLQEKLSFAGRWDRDFGRVFNDADRVDQRFRLPHVSVRNTFRSIRRTGRRALSFNSETDYETQPTQLRIAPMLYPDVFDDPEAVSGALQRLDSRRFRTRNSAFTSWIVGRWSFTLNAALNAQIEWMRSSLAPIDGQGAAADAASPHRNDIYWRRADLILGPSLRYGVGDRFSVSLYVPVDLLTLRSEDRVRNRTERSRDAIFTPSLSLQSNLTYNLKATARASYYEAIGGLYDNYAGYVMTDYRQITSKQGPLSRNRTQNYSVSLSYGNAIRALFGSVDASYRRTRRNLMYGVTYEGSLARIEAVERDNSSHGYDLRASVSKRFDGISTTFNLSGGFSRTWSEVMRQGELLPTQYDGATAALGFNTRFTRAVKLDYEASYARSKSSFEGTALRPIDVVRQNAAVDFIVRKKFICRIGGEHYYNAAIGGSDRNMFFLDAALTYKSRRVEYSVEGRNLADVGTFRSASQSDITDYLYTYRLRPASVLFKVKFSLK